MNTEEKDIRKILFNDGCVKGKWVAECQPNYKDCLECTLELIMEIIDAKHEVLTEALYLAQVDLKFLKKKYLL